MECRQKGRCTCKECKATKYSKPTEIKIDFRGKEKQGMIVPQLVFITDEGNENNHGKSPDNPNPSE